MGNAELVIKINEIFDDAKRKVLELVLQTESAPSKGNMLTAKDVASLLKVSKSKVYEMRRDGRLPADIDMKGCKDRYRWFPSTIYSFTGAVKLNRKGNRK